MDQLTTVDRSRNIGPATISQLEIIYEDEFCVAVNKPAGLLVHRTSLDTRATTNAVRILKQQLGRLVYPVHRLDRPTSGVLIFALDPEVSRQFMKAYETRLVSKTYLGVVRGWTCDTGSIGKPLQVSYDRIAAPDAKERPEQPALTDFVTRDRCTIPFSAGRYPESRYSLVEIHPTTGRRHQIRRHFNGISHPILGDSKHGDHRHNKLIVREAGIGRMFLAASYLELEHPVTGQPLRLSADPGEDFRRGVEWLGMSMPDVLTRSTTGVEDQE